MPNKIKMSPREVKQRIQGIKDAAIAGDFERANASESQLHQDFAAHMATEAPMLKEPPGVKLGRSLTQRLTDQIKWNQKIAKLVVSTRKISFTRARA